MKRHAIARHRRLIWPILVVLIALVLLPFPVAARSEPVVIQRYDIVAELLDGGAMRVTETIRYQVCAETRDLLFTIPKGQDQKISLERIAVADTITRIDQALFIETLLAESSSGKAQAMTYHLEQTERQLNINLHLFLRAGSYRTISLVYRVEPAVWKHQGTALLEHCFFARPDDIPVGQVMLKVVLPRPVPTSLIWSLASSLSTFSTTGTRSDQLVWQRDGLPEGHFLHVTCLLPSDQLTQLPEAPVALTAAQLKEEARQADQLLHRQASWRSLVTSAIFILIAMAALLLFIVYWFFDREGAMPDRQRLLREPPYACSPVVLALLLRKKRPAQLIMTALLDLVRQRFLLLENSSFVRTDKEEDPSSPLLESDRFLLQWLFSQLAVDRVLTVSRLRSCARQADTAETFRAQLTEYLALLDGELVSQGLLDLHKSSRGRLIARLAASAYAVLAIATAVFMQQPLAWLLFLPAAVFLLYSMNLRRLTNRGREKYAAGQALARYLRRIGRLPPYPDQDRQNHLLPYAMALGFVQPFLADLPAIWQDKPIHEELSSYGISRKKSLPLKDQAKQLSSDLHLMESILSASLLLVERIQY